MEPFRLHYALSRRQRLAVELPAWLPAMAGTIGFVTGAAYLVASVSPWCSLLLLLPVIVYRGLFVFAFGVIFCGGRPTELFVDDAEMELRIAGESQRLPLDGVFQVFRSGDVWTVLHLDGTVLTIPADAITSEQVEYLRSFAHRRLVSKA